MPRLWPRTYTSITKQYPKTTITGGNIIHGTFFSRKIRERACRRDETTRMPAVEKIDGRSHGSFPKGKRRSRAVPKAIRKGTIIFFDETPSRTSMVTYTIA